MLFFSLPVLCEASHNEYYGYDDMMFILDYLTGDIGHIELNPSAFTVDGVTLDKDREGLLKILGNPTDEGWADGEYGGYYLYYERSAYSMQITLTDRHDGEITDFSIWAN